MNMDNKEHVEYIAKRLTEIANGDWYICHACGEMVHADSLGDNVGNETLSCPSCDSDDFTTMSLFDYFQDVFNIEYRVESRRSDTIKSVELLVTYGGPDIYIDTGDRKVKLYWGCDYAEARIPQHVAELIRDSFEDLWRCS
jgi:hypothetical protein